MSTKTVFESRYARLYGLTEVTAEACLQVACILLPLCFLYDVFWVFLQPLLTNGDSVMVKVSILRKSPTVVDRTLLPRLLLMTLQVMCLLLLY